MVRESGFETGGAAVADMVFQSRKIVAPWRNTMSACMPEFFEMTNIKEV
jgi:hypothetical protein